MGDYFYKYNPLFKKDIMDIYHSWININKSLYIKYYNLVALILMSLLIPLDFILYRENNIYTESRILFIIIILINFVYIQINQDKLFIKQSQYKIHFNLLLPGMLFNLLYLYYFIKTPNTNYSIILLANFITIITTSMFAMKFWKEQYILNIGSMLFICCFINMKPIGCIYLILFHMLSFITAYLYRRKFIISMYERYCNTASLVPKNIAKYIMQPRGPLRRPRPGEQVPAHSKRFVDLFDKHFIFKF